MSTVLTLGSLGLIVYCIAMDYAALPGHPAMHYALFVFSLVLLAWLPDADLSSREAWAVLGISVAKTLLTAVASYVSRLKVPPKDA